MGDWIPPGLWRCGRRFLEWTLLRRRVKAQEAALERLRDRVEILEGCVALLEHDRWTRRRAAGLSAELRSVP